MVMIDSGANINLAPVWLAEALGLHIFPHTDGRSVGTAKSGGIMHIVGWIFPPAFTGPIALVEHATFMLLSVTELQRNGMGVHFPAGELICQLKERVLDEEVVYVEVAPLAPISLYFMDVRKLLYSARSEFIPQLGDSPISPDNVVGGGNGYVACVTMTNITDVDHIPETGHTAFGTASTE